MMALINKKCKSKKDIQRKQIQPKIQRTSYNIPSHPLEYIQMPCSIKMHKILNIDFQKSYKIQVYIYSRLR